ncbi:MAG: DNA polymerase Y family protein [Proteobacteria bacterium]|nr:DNA polymerase Y family protein [Pseudomonadota bacterium]
MTRRRYLALWFPFLPAERLRIEQGQHHGRTSGGQADPPAVLVAKVRGGLRLAAVNSEAQALGVVPGLTLADARAMQPGLIVAEMDTDADRHWLQHLARRCSGWSPLVTVASPDGITLDISGVDHLFCGEAGLAAQIRDAFDELGMTMRLAGAALPAAAQALARHGASYGTVPVDEERQAIRALPIAALELDEEASLALRRAGLKTIGDVAARPAASIAARFGAGAVAALRRMTGEEQVPITPLTQPVPLRFTRRFAEPVALQATIAACFMDLLREAARVLEQRDLGGKRFVLTLFRSDGARRRLDIETGLPTRDPALVLRLFNERIASLADPLDPGFGYDRITLFLPATEPLPGVQPALDGGGQAETALAELIDRLSTRLGAASLCRLAPQDRHLPEQAQLALSAIGNCAPARWPAPAQDEPPLRPLFLFDPPQVIEAIAEVPDGPPRRFRWRRTLHEVRLYEGPERIATEWWRRKAGAADGKGGLTRDYYRVEDKCGRRYWIFRHGLYSEVSDPRQGPKWYLHGLFA